MSDVDEDGWAFFEKNRGRDDSEFAAHDQFIAAQRAEFDIDEANIPSVPDITRGQATIDIEDPLLPAFTYQHDLRERFLTALREAVAVLREIDTIDPEHTGPTLERIELARSIIEHALDPDAIAQWNDEGRPLPSIPEVVASRGEAIDGAVTQIAAMGRFNVWGYDPRQDYWAIVDESLNAGEAHEALAALEEDPPSGMEYLILVVGQHPRPE